MYAFISAILAIAVISLGANIVLNDMGWSSAEVYQSDNVRLD